jgi:hypothetical protein
LYRIGSNNWALAAGGQKIVDISTSGIGVTGTVTASGEITANGGIALGDGDVATFGDSDALSIVHAGGTTYLTNTTGSLVLRTDSFRVLNTANSEQILHGDANGAVTAYYDNSIKLATTATGIDVTGTVTASTSFATGVGIIKDIDSNSVMIGSGAVNLRMIDVTGDIRPVTANGLGVDATIDLGDAGARFKDLYLSGTSNVGVGRFTAQSLVHSAATLVLGHEGSSKSQIRAYGINAGTVGSLEFNVSAADGTGSKSMTLDASGNLLVGKTASNSTVAGAQLNANGLIIGTTSETNPLLLNRLSTDGDIITIQKDGAAVGSIGANGGNIYIGQGDTTIMFSASSDAILPKGTGGASRDNAIDLGQASVNRFNDAFITNGVTTGSDGNDKQDIETLSEAEQRVAVACKGLLRKWRWKSAVEEKGDDARIHFGIIAQDLQAAFEAEGLDAGRYAMFMSNTWADEETGEERTRLGIRYHELLAFIIAAI